MLINFKRFHIYCYLQEQLIALGKLQLIHIRYAQNPLEEIYEVNCKIFEMDKYAGDRRQPMIMLRQEEQTPHNPFTLHYLFHKT